MTAVARDLDVLAHATADRDLLAEFLTTRSDVNAELAYVTLSRLLDDSQLLALANLRELILELPQTPFHTGAEITMLKRALGYDFTGYSYRMRFQNDPTDVFGLEFVGSANTVELIVLHTLRSRYPIHGSREFALDPAVAHLLIAHPAILQRILEAFESLGAAMEPRFYLGADEYAVENAAAVADDLRRLF